MREIGGYVRDVPYRMVQRSLAGQSDVSATIQALHDALYALYGCGEIRFPEGTFNCNLTINEKMALVGCGSGITTLKSVAGSNLDVIKGKDFATLTGKSYASGDITRGAYRTHLRGLTIDGNRSNNTAGFGIRIWGCGHRWHDIKVQNCDEDGIWTEFTTHDAGTPDDMLEGYFEHIQSNNNDGNGWTFRGPHDSWIENFIPVSNGGWGFQSSASSGSYNGVCGGRSWNSWLNTTGSFDFGASVTDLCGGTASGAYVGTGVRFGATTGAGRLRAFLVSGHETGVVLTGSSNSFEGVILNCRNAGDSAGQAITVDSATRCWIKATGEGNYSVLNVVSESGPNDVDLNFAVASGKAFLTGSAASTIVRTDVDGIAASILSDYRLREIHAGSGTAVYIRHAPKGEENIAGQVSISGTGGMLASDPIILNGSGSPEGVVTAPVASLYLRIDGGAGSTLYAKESGSGNTGWAAR